MNRQVRTRMPGGVGGARLKPAPIPIDWYACHGVCFMGCKSPVRERGSCCFDGMSVKHHESSTRRGQLRCGNKPWGGSLRGCA